MDHAQLNQATGCHSYPDIRLDAIRGDNTTNPPIGGTTVYWLPNNHKTYIATWYGLSAALVGMMVLSRKGKLR